jgi:hypothetical protein
MRYIGYTLKKPGRPPGGFALLADVQSSSAARFYTGVNRTV